MTTKEQSEFVAERLEFIQNSILKTRQNLKENSFFFLFWGWLILATTLIHYITLYVIEYEHHWLPWPVLMTLGAIVSVVKGIRMDRATSHRSHLDNFMIWMWSSCGILFFVVDFIAIRYGIIPIPFVLAIAGAGTLATGGLIKFRPVIIGGIAFFLAAIASALTPLELQLPILAAGFTVGYLIPGYMLKRSK